MVKTVPPNTLSTRHVVRHQWTESSSTDCIGDIFHKELFIHSFIHSDHFYSAPSSLLPLRGAPDYSTDTVSEFHAEAHRQLQVNNFPKPPTSPPQPQPN